MNATLLFLPGASGNTAFWKPVASKLTSADKKIHLDWPGFGPSPAHPDVNSFDDLVKRVTDHINGPTVLIAQSMGGVIAVLAALAKPQWVTQLVLTVTSGGLDMERFGAKDWRPGFFNQHPAVPDWFARCQHDLTARLSELTLPTLLIWGDSDPISPVAVGQALASQLPNAQLHIIPGGDHDVAHVFSDEVAQRINAFLRES